MLRPARSLRGIVPVFIAAAIGSPAIARADLCSDMQYVAGLAAQNSLSSIATGPVMNGGSDSLPLSDDQATTYTLAGAQKCGIANLSAGGAYSCDFDPSSYTEAGLDDIASSCFPGAKSRRDKIDGMEYTFSIGGKQAQVTVSNYPGALRITINEYSDDSDDLPF